MSSAGGFIPGMTPGPGSSPGFNPQTLYAQTGIPGMNGGFAYMPGSGMCQFMDQLNSTMANASLLGQMPGTSQPGSPMSMPGMSSVLPGGTACGGGGQFPTPGMSGLLPAPGGFSTPGMSGLLPAPGGFSTPGMSGLLPAPGGFSTPGMSGLPPAPDGGMLLQMLTSLLGFVMDRFGSA